jgi:LacI family transcriptional regulator
MKRATVRDVARLTNLSVGAVSQILSGKRKGRPENVAKVNAAVKQLGYRSNLTARNLSSGQTKTIGLSFFFNPEHIFTGQLLRNVEVKCREAGYAVIPINLYPSDYPSLEFRRITRDARVRVLEQLIDRRVDGIISQGFLVSSESAQMLIDEGVKVAIWQPEEEMPNGVTTCQPDWRMIFTLAVRHLYESGCRSFVFLAGMRQFANTRESVAAFQSEVSALGLQSAQVNYSDSLASDEFATRAIEENFADDLRRTKVGLICGDDQLALGALAACARLGIEVPAQIRVIGINDAFYAKYVTPSLTTVRIDSEHAATQLVAGLLDSIQQPEHPSKQLYCSSALVVRASTEA